MCDCFIGRWYVHVGMQQQQGCGLEACFVCMGVFLSAVSEILFSCPLQGNENTLCFGEMVWALRCWVWMGGDLWFVS